MSVRRAIAIETGRRAIALRPAPAILRLPAMGLRCAISWRRSRRGATPGQGSGPQSRPISGCGVRNRPLPLTAGRGFARGPALRGRRRYARLPGNGLWPAAGNPVALDCGAGRVSRVGNRTGNRNPRSRPYAPARGPGPGKQFPLANHHRPVVSVGWNFDRFYGRAPGSDSPRRADCLHCAQIGSVQRLAQDRGPAFLAMQDQSDIGAQRKPDRGVGARQ